MLWRGTRLEALKSVAKSSCRTEECGSAGAKEHHTQEPSLGAKVGVGGDSRVRTIRIRNLTHSSQGKKVKGNQVYLCMYWLKLQWEKKIKPKTPKTKILTTKCGNTVHSPLKMKKGKKAVWNAW